MFSTRNCAIAACIAVAGLAAPAAAQTDDFQRQIDVMKRQVEEMRAAYERQINTLADRIKTMERQRAAQAAPAVAATRGTAASAGQQFQIGLSATGAGGGSSADNDVLSALQRGDHDPNKNGFTVQNVELFMGGSVDPYLDAQASIVMKIDSGGETKLELEEVFFTSRSLPAGLQVKGGQYFTEFGRANPQHPHQWDFADQPVVLSRLMGSEGLRSQGARVSWLTPLPWFSELTFGLQNSKGGTTGSFLGEAGESVGGFTLQDRSVRNFGDLLYSARWLSGVDLTDTVSANLGLSGALGPNATGENTDTFIVGGDVYVKWQPESTERGYPFVAFHGEALYRGYEALDESDTAHTTLDDWGFFAQSTWGFSPGWVAGLRLGFADGDGDNAADPVRDARWRLSPNLVWYPSEFSRFRLQYNRDWAQHLEGTDDGGGADTVWLQMEFSLGGHFAHTF
jgi:hypothetical protein